jgi:hypothetical protein
MKVRFRKILDVCVQNEGESKRKEIITLYKQEILTSRIRPKTLRVGKTVDVNGRT